MSSNSDSDTVEVGEITVQYTAHGEAAAEEMAQFRKQLRKAVSGLESANAVAEMHSLPEFDARLSWGSDEESDATTQSSSESVDGIERRVSIDTPFHPSQSRGDDD